MDQSGHIIHHTVKVRLKHTKLIASGNFDLLGKITARHTMCRILEFFDLAVKTERCQDCDHTSKDQTDHTGHQRSYVNVDQVLLVFLITDTAEQSPSGNAVCHRRNGTVPSLCTHGIRCLQYDIIRCRIFIFPIVDEGNCYGYLLLSLDERTDTLSPERSIKIQQILAIMKFEIIKSDEIAHTVNRYYDFLLDELVESEQTDFRKLMQKYGLVQKVIYDEYYVLIAGRTPQSTSDTFFHELLTSQQFNALYDHLVNALGTINFFLFERKDYIVTLLPKQLVSRGKPDFERVISLFREFLQEQYNGVGISGIVPTERVRQGYLQALKALAISQHSLNKASCYYDELGILRFFFDRSNQVDFAPLLQVYQEYIQPITDYDSRHSGDLLPTLTAYITCCASPSAICNLLYIHKNTLYARLNKISQILEKDLSDSETVFNLSLGLKIQTLIQAGILDRDLDP